MTDWPIKTLGDVCEVIAGQSPEGKFYNKEGKGVPFYQGKKDFAERVLGSPTIWTTEVTKLSRPGDILMSVRAPVGPVNLCPIEACIGRGLAAIRPSSKTDTDFIFYYLESIQSEIAGTEGAVFASINKAQIADLRCPVPPLEEQKRIVALLDAATARVTELTACYEQARTHADNLFTSALRDALEGNPDWPVKTLGEVAVLNPSEPALSEDAPFVPMDAVTAGKRQVQYTQPRGQRSGARARAGDILFARITPCLQNGKVALVQDEIERCGGSTEFIVVRAGTDVLNSFLYQWITAKHIRDHVTALMKGATGRQRLNAEDLALTELPVPSLEEQKRIVARLDAMRAKTSEMVAAYDAKLTAAKNLRQSALEAAFAGEL
jgi:type I restriction enzyme S subunit